MSHILLTEWLTGESDELALWKNGVRYDNVTEEDIIERIRRGELNASTLVWQQGMLEWQPVSATSLAEILKQSEVPPALPGHRIPGGVVWRWHLPFDWIHTWDVDCRAERYVIWTGLWCSQRRPVLVYLSDSEYCSGISGWTKTP